MIVINIIIENDKTEKTVKAKLFEASKDECEIERDLADLYKALMGNANENLINDLHESKKESEVIE